MIFLQTWSPDMVVEVQGRVLYRSSLKSCNNDDAGVLLYFVIGDHSGLIKIVAFGVNAYRFDTIVKMNSSIQISSGVAQASTNYHFRDQLIDIHLRDESDVTYLGEPVPVKRP